VSIFRKVSQDRVQPHACGAFLLLLLLVSLAMGSWGCSGLVSGNAVSQVQPASVVITTSSLPAGTPQAAYSAILSVSGGTAPYSWSLSSGSLPAGLTLSNGGQISGTPTSSGTASFTVKVTDSSSPAQSATKNLSIVVAAGVTPLQITTTSLPDGRVSSAYSTTLTANGGTTPYTWSIASGSLPAGLLLGAPTGQILGTPTTTGTSSFTISVKDSSAVPQSATTVLSIFVSATGTGTSITSCQILSNSGTTYVLQNDVSSTGTCFTLAASGITLDLNGHTVTYDTGATASVYGVTAGSVTGSHITSSVAGGTVAQSTACKVNVQTTGGGLCATADPIHMPRSVEVDHLLLVDYGLDNQAINLGGIGGSLVSIHDNQICPYHTKVTLDHFANFGEIYVKNGSNVTINNNDIGTTCLAVTGQSVGFTSMMGIFFDSPGTNVTITNNRIAIVAPVRDSYGITIGCSASTNIGFEIAHNTVSSGRGIFVEGWNSSSSPGCGLGTVHDNIVTANEALTVDGPSGGYTSGDPIGIQVRFGSHDIQVYNNNITVHSGPGVCPVHFFTDVNSDCVSQGAIKLMGGPAAANITASNNTITATTTSASFPVSAIYGDLTPPDPGVSGFFNNNITSNGTIVDVTQPDGCGNYWTFKGNTFIEAANPMNFVTFHTSWYCNPGQDTTHNVFIDNTYVGPDTNQDDINGPPTGAGDSYSYFIKWSYNATVLNGSTPVSGVTVTATATGGGTETVSGITDVNGKVTLILTNHSASGTNPNSPTRVNYTPHSISYSGAGCSSSTSVTIIAPTNANLPCF